MNRRDLQALTKIRLTEARALLDTGYSDGAYYLAGYAVDMAGGQKRVRVGCSTQLIIEDMGCSRG